jgi:PST family polysaccharide transporter
MNTVLCTQWMVPLGMDTLLNRVVLAAGLLNVCLASLLASRFQQLGMAVAVASAELFIAVTCSIILYRHTHPALPIGANQIGSNEASA